MRKSAGFTLIEMVVVLFLTTLILGLTTIIFASALTSSRFDKTVNDMRTSIRAARHLARKSGKTQILTIDLSKGKYNIRGLKGKEIPTNVHVIIINPGSDEIRQGKYEIAFRPYGGSPGERIIFSGGKKRASIKMDPVLGAVIIK
jgi:prepilin-type N-terminal cleavage/methylation domain-containing protein